MQVTLGNRTRNSDEDRRWGIHHHTICHRSASPLATSGVDGRPSGTMMIAYRWRNAHSQSIDVYGDGIIIVYMARAMDGKIFLLMQGRGSR